MIQRIQSVYLLIAAGLSAGIIFLCHLWINIKGDYVYAQDETVYFACFIGSSVLSLISILNFKKRQLQFVLGRLNIILNFILLGLFVFRSLNISGETDVSEKGIGMLVPVLSIVLLVLANKAIKKDEDLVKSVDRLR